MTTVHRMESPLYLEERMAKVLNKHKKKRSQFIQRIERQRRRDRLVKRVADTIRVLLFSIIVMFSFSMLGAVFGRLIWFWFA